MNQRGLRLALGASQLEAATRLYWIREAHSEVFILHEGGGGAQVENVVVPLGLPRPPLYAIVLSSLYGKRSITAHAWTDQC